MFRRLRDWIRVQHAVWAYKKMRRKHGYQGLGGQAQDD